MLTPLVWISSLSFFGYGVLCFTAPYTMAEFDRYGMPGMRTLTGTLQILAAAGLVIGFLGAETGSARRDWTRVANDRCDRSSPKNRR